MTHPVEPTVEQSARVMAVIVSFNPDIAALEQTIHCLIKQNCAVALVDNASANQAEIKSKNWPVTVVLNARNLGLGAAHNQGLSEAKKQDMDYLLILDQDSLPSSNMVEQLLAAHHQQSTRHKVSAVGATYLNTDNQSRSFFVRFGWLKFARTYAQEHAVEADFLISSGSLFAVSTLSEIGGMDEALFIDHVDTEWFLRARSQGYKAFGVGSALMHHGLGEATHQIKLAGRRRNVPQHKPFRYYYIVRNSVLLYRRRYTSWLWKWNDLQRLFMIAIMFTVLKGPRGQNARMMLLGLWHGLKGQSGEMPDYLQTRS